MKAFESPPIPVLDRHASFDVGVATFDKADGLVIRRPQPRIHPSNPVVRDIAEQQYDRARRPRPVFGVGVEKRRVQIGEPPHG